MPKAATTAKTDDADEAPAPDRPVHTGEVLYDDVTVSVRDKDHDGPIYAEEMMGLVGWDVEQKDNEFGADYDLVDATGKKVRMVHNTGNRWHEADLAERYAYEILNRNWAGPTCLPGETINGEPMIFSRTGTIRSGQHRGAGLILAKQIWDRDDKWKENWPEEPCLETLLVFGVSDAHAVTRTYDAGRPRTAADTLYSTDRFVKKEYGRGDRKNLVKIAAEAVRLLWGFTGAGSRSGTTPHFTQTEMEKWFAAHPWLEEAVEWVYNNNKPPRDDAPGVLTRYGKPGTLAALLYLSAASATDRKEYLKSRSEEGVDFANREAAVNFWTELALGHLRAVADARYPAPGNYLGVENYKGVVFPTGTDTGAPPTPAGLKNAQLAKGWLAFLAGGVDGVTPPTVRLDYTLVTPGGEPLVDKDGQPVMDKKTKKQVMVVDQDGYKSFSIVPFGGVEAGDDEDKNPGRDAGDSAGEAGPSQPTATMQVRRLEADFPGEFISIRLVPKNEKGEDDMSRAHHRVFGKSAKILVAQFGLEPYLDKNIDADQVRVPLEDWITERYADRLVGAGFTVREITEMEQDKAGYFSVKKSSVRKPKTSEPTAGNPKAAKPPEAAADGKPAAKPEPAKPKPKPKATASGAKPAGKK